MILLAFQLHKENIEKDVFYLTRSSVLMLYYIYTYIAYAERWLQFFVSSIQVSCITYLTIESKVRLIRLNDAHSVYISVFHPGLPLSVERYWPFQSVISLACFR